MTSFPPAPQAATAIDRPVVLVCLTWFLRCLTAAWLATAVLYGLSVGTLPEPIVALATTVALAVLIATALVGLGLEQASHVPLPSAPVLPPSAPNEPPPSLASRHEPDAVPGPAPPLDPAAYPRAKRGLCQCPRCGSFAVTTIEDAGQQANTCRICSQVWHSGAGLPDPDVVVRSWLHR
jgi:hypothetical protein